MTSFFASHCTFKLLSLSESVFVSPDSITIGWGSSFIPNIELREDPEYSSSSLFIFFGKTRKIYGVKKRTDLFQTHNCEKSSFSTRSYVYLPGYTQIRDRGANRVKASKFTFLTKRFSIQISQFSCSMSFDYSETHDFHIPSMGTSV